MTIDTATNLFMQSIENPALTFVSKIIDQSFEPIIMLIAAAAISTFLYFKKSKKKAIFFASIMLVAAAAIYIIKELIQRTRPFNTLIQETSFSFPSGHATIAVVFFGGLVFLFTKRNKILNYTLASILILFTGFTRIYLRVHWLTDVTIAFILGILILSTAIIIYNKK